MAVSKCDGRPGGFAVSAWSKAIGTRLRQEYIFFDGAALLAADEGER